MIDIPEDAKLLAGIAIGLAGGIFGSIFVTSMYRCIDGCANWDLATFFVALIFFIVIMLVILRKMHITIKKSI